MRCPTVFGSHLKEEFFVTHSKNVFLTILFKNVCSFIFLCEETICETD